MNDIGVGIIGLGFMGKTQTETISKYCRGAKVRAVTDVDAARAQEVAAKYGIDWTKSVDDLLARKDIDAVYIETPHHLHGEQALAAIRAGKHVMIEKPMAHTVKLCDQIIEASEKAGVHCSITFSQRSRVCNIKAKQLIDEGALGRVRQILEFHLLAGGLIAFPKWQSDQENLGILFGHAIHNFDRIRWFTGAEIATVYASCTTLDPNVHVEATSMVMMTLTDGTAVTLWSSGELPKPSFPTRDFGAMVVGDKALMDLDSYNELKINVGGQWKVVEKQAPVDWAGKGFLDPVRLESFTRHSQGFFDAIRENRKPPVTGWDGRQAVAAVLAAYESAKTGKVIKLK